MDTEYIGQFLSQIRQEMWLSEEEVAQSLGVTVDDVYSQKRLEIQRGWAFDS